MPRALLSRTPRTSRTSRALRRTALAVAAVGALGTAAVPAPPVPVAAPATRPLAAVTDSAAATTGTSVAVAGRQYSFSTVVGGEPVRWDPCTPIHWRANVSRAPLGGLTVLKSAVAAVAAATGTTWVYDGTSTAIPSTSALPTSPAQTRPVLLGWTDGATSNLLRDQPASVLGMTRTAWFGVSSPTGAVAATRGAVVALDRTDRLPLTGPTSWTAVAVHELGHVMGLAHPTDSSVLMASRLPAAASGLQAGDRAGLALVGRSQGCVQVPAL